MSTLCQRSATNSPRLAPVVTASHKNVASSESVTHAALRS